MTFHGNFNSSKEVLDHVHESPIVMLIPLFVLALGAIFSGWYFYNDFVGYNWKEFWGNSIFISEKHKAFKLAHYVPLWVKYLPIFLATALIETANKKNNFSNFRYTLCLFILHIKSKFAKNFDKEIFSNLQSVLQ